MRHSRADVELLRNPAHGWIAVDFYDGCLIYDFDRRDIHIVNLEHYHRIPCETT